MSEFKVTVMYGRIEVKQENRFENGKMVCYGWSIHYDREGNEISRTEPEALSSIGWSNGKPFTETDIKGLIS